MQDQKLDELQVFYSRAQKRLKTGGEEEKVVWKAELLKDDFYEVRDGATSTELRQKFGWLGSQVPDTLMTEPSKSSVYLFAEEVHYCQSKGLILYSISTDDSHADLFAFYAQQRNLGFFLRRDHNGAAPNEKYYIFNFYSDKQRDSIEKNVILVTQDEVDFELVK